MTKERFIELLRDAFVTSVMLSVWKMVVGL